MFSDMLYMLVRYASPSGPMCLRCLMLTLPCPMELLFLLCFIVTWTCVGDMCVVFVIPVCVYISDLCVCMKDVISEFNSEIEGSLACCALILFLCSIFCLMCSESSVHVECTRLLGCCVCLRGE